MTLQIGINSFVDVDYADEYFADQIGGESWSSVVNKETCLISAFRQMIAFCNFDFEYDVAPENVKFAQCEIANAISTYGLSVEEKDNISKLKAGSVEISFDTKESTANPSFISQYVEALLKDCSCNFSGNGIDFYVGNVLY